MRGAIGNGQRRHGRCDRSARPVGLRVRARAIVGAVRFDAGSRHRQRSVSRHRPAGGVGSTGGGADRTASRQPEWCRTRQHRRRRRHRLGDPDDPFPQRPRLFSLQAHHSRAAYRTPDDGARHRRHALVRTTPSGEPAGSRPALQRDAHRRHQLLPRPGGMGTPAQRGAAAVDRTMRGSRGHQSVERRVLNRRGGVLVGDVAGGGHRSPAHADDVRGADLRQRPGRGSHRTSASGRVPCDHRIGDITGATGSVLRTCQ